MITRFLPRLWRRYRLNVERTRSSEALHVHEALHGDSAVIELVRRLRDLRHEDYASSRSLNA